MQGGRGGGVIGVQWWPGAVAAVRACCEARVGEVVRACQEIEQINRGFVCRISLGGGCWCLTEGGPQGVSMADRQYSGVNRCCQPLPGKGPPPCPPARQHGAHHACCTSGESGESRSGDTPAVAPRAAAAPPAFKPCGTPPTSGPAVFGRTAGTSLQKNCTALPGRASAADAVGTCCAAAPLPAAAPAAALPVSPTAPVPAPLLPPPSPPPLVPPAPLPGMWSDGCWAAVLLGGGAPAGALYCRRALTAWASRSSVMADRCRRQLGEAVLLDAGRGTAELSRACKREALIGQGRQNGGSLAAAASQDEHGAALLMRHPRVRAAAVRAATAVLQQHVRGQCTRSGPQ